MEDFIEHVTPDPRHPGERPEHRGVLGDRGRFLLFDDRIEREAVAFAPHHLRGIVDDRRAVVDTLPVVLDAVLVEGEEDVDLCAVRPDRPLRGPDDREVVPAPDERGVIEVHVGAVAEAGEEAGDGEARRVDPLPRLAADQDGVFGHGDQTWRSPPAGIYIVPRA